MVWCGERTGGKVPWGGHSEGVHDPRFLWFRVVSIRSHLHDISDPPKAYDYGRYPSGCSLYIGSS